MSQTFRLIHDLDDATNGYWVLVSALGGRGDLTFSWGSGSGDMLAANNLSDVASVATARANLGLSAVLFDHYADAANVTTGETDLYSDTLAAGRLANNGEKIEAEYGGVFVSSATATRQVKVYFGGTVILDTGALTLSLSSAWTAYVTIIRKSATVVRYMVSFATEGAALAAYTSAGEVTSLTLSNTQVVKVTGQAAGVGAASGDITAKLGSLEWKPAA